MAETQEVKPKESSAKRSESGGNPNTTPQEERLPGPAGDLQPALSAAQQSVAVSAAALGTAVAADARLKSDPRYERDQEIYKLGQQGALLRLPDPGAELPPIRMQVVTEDDINKPPSNAREQLERDRQRLDTMKSIQEETNKRLAEVQEAAQKASDEVNQTAQEVSKKAAEKSDELAKVSQDKDAPIPAANQPIVSTPSTASSQSGKDAVYKPPEQKK